MRRPSPSNLGGYQSRSNAILRQHLQTSRKFLFYFPVTPLACSKANPYQLWFAITDVIGDVLVIALPVYNVWKLQMPKRNKYAVTFIFLLGALSTAAGIVRLGLVVKASKGEYAYFMTSSPFHLSIIAQIQAHEIMCSIKYPFKRR
jgi:hypothetical protein